MKRTKITVYKTVVEPANFIPFVMVPNSVFHKYESGEINGEKFLIFLMLSKKVNPHNGVGVTSYAEISAWLKMKTSEQSINHINKIMVELRDRQVVWFLSHSGSRDFEYLVADFKLAKNSENESSKWVDIQQCRQSYEQNNSTVTKTVMSEVSPKQHVDEQRLESQKEQLPVEFERSIEDFKKAFGRGAHTETNT